MSDTQLHYRQTFSKISELLRFSPVETPAETDLHRDLYRTWLAMSKTEREPFLAPACAERRCDGPVNRDFDRP